MRGVILAAGRGSRLGALTDERPKCLVPLAGRTLLDWQRSALTAAGVGELGVVTGYRGELVAERGLMTFPARRWAETTMVGSLLAASPWLEAGPCVVSYGDIVYTAGTVRALVTAPGELAISYDPQWAGLWHQRFADPREDAESFRLTADGCLAEIGAPVRDLSQVEGQYMGLLRFTPRSWAAALRVLGGREEVLDMTALLQELVEDGQRVETVPCDGPWCEVDGPGDLRVGEEIVCRNEEVFAW